MCPNFLKVPWLLYGEWTIGKYKLNTGRQVGRFMITVAGDDGGLPSWVKLARFLPVF